MHVHASIGIAYSKLGAEDPAELLQAADVAMYAAKARGKNCYEVYKPALQDGRERAARTDRRAAAGRRRGRVRPPLPAHRQPGRRRAASRWRP